MENDPYASHWWLLSSLGYETRSVLELGCGKYSTSLFLNRDIFPCLERLVSIDHSQEWIDQLPRDKRLRSMCTTEPIEEALDDIDLNSFDLIFIDNSEHLLRRAATIRWVAGRVYRSLVVIHDFEHIAYQNAAAKLKTILVDRHVVPWTALLRRA